MLNDLRSDTSNDTVDINEEGVRAVNAILREVLGIHKWEFSIKSKRINYYDGVEYYPIDDDYVDLVSVLDTHTVLDPFVRLKLGAARLRLNGSSSENIVADGMLGGKNVLLISYPFSDSRAFTLLGNTGYDSNGTWINVSGVSNIGTDTNTTVRGNQCVIFDLASGASELKNEDMGVYDASGLGRDYAITVPVNLPSGVTSVTLKWGSSTSDYRSVRVTTDAGGAAIGEGDRQLLFKYSDASVTGTPTGSIGYVSLSFDSGTNIKNIRLGCISISTPHPLEVQFYSNSVVYDVSANAATDKFDNTDANNDYGLWSTRSSVFSSLLEAGAAARVLRMMGERTEASYYMKQYCGSDTFPERASSAGGLLGAAISSMPSRSKKYEPPRMSLPGVHGRDVIYPES